MAKITRHGGASDKTLPVTAGAAPEPPVEAASAPQPEPVDVTEDLAGPPVPVVEEGGEEPSVGSSSSASTETQPQSSETSSSGPRKRARKTASRSGPDPTESSSAPSTDGAKTDGTSATDTTDN